MRCIAVPGGKQHEGPQTLPIMERCEARHLFCAVHLSGAEATLLDGPAADGVYTARVNFGPSRTAGVSGYLLDSGSSFSEAREAESFGWVAQPPLEGRIRRNARSQDDRFDSFLVVPIGGTWELAVPNGNYTVRVASGDAQTARGGASFSVEGIAAVDGLTSKQQRWLEGTVTVAVTDGRLTLTNSGIAAAKLNFIDVAAAASEELSNPGAPNGTAIDPSARALSTAIGVSSFTLVNAATDRDVRLLANNDTINLAVVGSQLNVRANSFGTVGSVKFVLDERQVRVESGKPFALATDNKGDYQPWTPSLGRHTLEAIAYSGASATGSNSATFRVAFSVVNEPIAPPPPPTDPTPTDPPDNSTVPPPPPPIDGGTDGNPNDGETPVPPPPPPPPIDDGNDGDDDTTVPPPPPPPPPPVVLEPALSKLTLVNSATDKPIGELVADMTIDLRVVGSKLNVEAIAASGLRVGSVVFALSGQALRTESTAPFSLAGDSGANKFDDWTPAAGTYTLTATPWTLSGGRGVAGKPIEVNFSVVNAAEETEPPPAPIPTSLSFRTVTRGPVSRAEALGAVVNGKFYVMGGFTGMVERTRDTWIATRRCDVYDPSTNSWKRVADMPEAFTHASAVVVGTDIWFVGGYVGNHPGPGSRKVWRYSTVKNAWTRGPDLPVARGAGGAAMIDGVIHFVGGMDQARKNDTADMWSLDLAASNPSWVKRKSMSVARNHLSVVATGGKLLAISGQLQQEEKQVALRTVEAYNPATDTWTRLADMPTPRSHVTSGVFTDSNGRVVMVGGETGYNLVQRSVYMYDPLTDKWTQIGNLPSARSTVVAGQLPDGRYIIATGNSPGRTDTTWIATPG